MQLEERSDEAARRSDGIDVLGSIQRASETDALRIALLVRSTPVAPQSLLSCAFSFTPMRLSTFVGATWLGLLPITCFQVHVGSLVHDAAELLEGKRPPLGALGWVATGGGLVVSLVAIGALARIGQRALRRYGILGPRT